MYDDELTLDDLYPQKKQEKVVEKTLTKKKGRKKANPNLKAKHIDITLYPKVIQDIDETIEKLAKKGIIMTRSKLLTRCFYRVQELEGLENIKQF